MIDLETPRHPPRQLTSAAEGLQMQTNGTCSPAFDAVRTAFAANFDAGSELGASVAVTVNGEFVVDLWAGLAASDGRPWEQDTIVNVYSSTKTMAALCVLMLADRGKLDLDAPVATYWPEFAQNGKGSVLVSQVMAHSAGLPGFDPPVEVADLYDWQKSCDNLAAQAPWWQPGTAVSYHALTQGYLQGELVRRVDGRTLGTFFREEVAGPLGADFHIGLDASHDHRVAELVPPKELLSDGYVGEPGSVAARMGAGGPRLDATEPATRAWRAAEIPAANGHGNARSMGRIHSLLACGRAFGGIRLLSEKTLTRILEVQIEGDDLVLNAPRRFGMGYGLPTKLMPPLLADRRVFFWYGWGGSLAFIDLDARMSITYTMNRMTPELLGDARALGIATAAYTALFTAAGAAQTTG
jgi:CubicO group peptidase (beta-lactamase class C family)